jgi:hypothetical protein
MNICNDFFSRTTVAPRTSYFRWILDPVSERSVFKSNAADLCLGMVGLLKAF